MSLSERDARAVADYERQRAEDMYAQSAEKRVQRERLRYIEAVQGAPFGKPLFVQNQDGSYRPKRSSDTTSEGYVQTGYASYQYVSPEEAARMPGKVFVNKAGLWRLAEQRDHPPFFVRVASDRFKQWRPMGIAPKAAILRAYRGQSYSKAEYLAAMAGQGFTRAQVAAMWETLPVVYADPGVVQRARDWEARGGKPAVRRPAMGARRAEREFGDILSDGYTAKHTIDEPGLGEEAPYLAIGRYSPEGKQEMRMPATKPALFPTRESLRHWVPAPEQRAYWESLQTPSEHYSAADIEAARLSLAAREAERARQGAFLREYLARYR